jgi:DNA-directed RNA polymerase specialized sigma24 family protein
MVRAAEASADDALESLCTAYWLPLDADVRWHRDSKEDAEDLTQAFFAKLLERQDFAGLNQENGRFRAFLLVALKNFLSNERVRAGRQERGGNITHLSLDWQSADTQFQIAGRTQVPPDALYNRE